LLDTDQSAVVVVVVVASLNALIPTIIEHYGTVEHMNNIKVTVISAAICLVFSSGLMAESLTKDAYKAAENRIMDEYRTDKSACDSLSGNKKDICRAEAKGKEKVAEAELESVYEPSAKHYYKALVAKAEANFAIADEKCDDKSGNEKDVCVKEAKAAETSAKADAEVKMKTWNANREASDTSIEAGMAARQKGADARQEAATDTRDANYTVAREKCDSLSSDAKDRCVDAAKLKYDQ